MTLPYLLQSPKVGTRHLERRKSHPTLWSNYLVASPSQSSSSPPSVSVFVAADELLGDFTGLTQAYAIGESHSVSWPSDLHHQLGPVFAIPLAWRQR